MSRGVLEHDHLTGIDRVGVDHQRAAAAQLPLAQTAVVDVVGRIRHRGAGQQHRRIPGPGAAGDLHGAQVVDVEVVLVQPGAGIVAGGGELHRVGIDHAAVVVERGMAGFDDGAGEAQRGVGADGQHAAAAAGDADVENAAVEDVQRAAGALDVDVAGGRRAGIADGEVERGDGAAAEDRDLAGGLAADGQAAGSGSAPSRCRRR